jgi:hypothetical protein
MAVVENPGIGQKPRIVGIVGLSFLGALINVVQGVGLLAEINTAQARGATGIPGWVPLLAYVLVAFGLVQLVVAVLIMGYKRLGLQIGLVAYSISVLLILAQLAGNPASSGVFLPLLVQGAVVYYINKYLTHEPEKSYFT